MLKPKYDDITNIQTAINMAVAEKRVVRFLTAKTNAELKKEVIDLKGCKMMKPNKFSGDVAVVPAGVKNFDFDKIDTSVRSIWLPGDLL